jgi:hypothetical protein
MGVINELIAFRKIAQPWGSALISLAPSQKVLFAFGDDFGAFFRYDSSLMNPPELPEPLEALFRIQRALVGHVSYD